MYIIKLCYIMNYAPEEIPIPEEIPPRLKPKNITSEEVSKLERKDVGRAEDSDQKKEKEKREITRSWIGTIYVCGYLLIIMSGLIIGCRKNFSIFDYKDILLTISAVLSGPLGFIIGYYFKAAKE